MERRDLQALPKSQADKRISTNSPTLAIALDVG
jgi:hypothetical protein